jgi:phosphatidylglycerophosphate synthase
MHSSTPLTTPALPRASSALRRDAAQTIVGTALLLAAAVVLLGVTTELSAWFAAKALGLFALASACVWHGLGAHAPQTRLGPANGVTLLRLALITLLAAGVGEPIAVTASLKWAALCVAMLAAVLDAVDGPIARRRQQASAFGARFDMETDALLILVLSALVLSFGQAGAWVLAAGALRYAFVLAALPWPWLAAPLPASTRRKTVCVVQIVMLIVCLAPIVPPEWARWIAGAGLAALVYSFAVDTVWLARRRPLAMETAP